MRKPPPSGTPLERPEAFLAEFATRFVRSGFRDRFVHEAINKPQRLATRICHSIEEVFSSSYIVDGTPFESGDACVPISGTDLNLQECHWSDLALYVNRGSGVLVASKACDRFYAETESEHGFPYTVYSGKIRKT
jgi:hypothetical protein